MMFIIMVLPYLLAPYTAAATDGTCPDDMQLFKRPDGTLDCLYCRDCPAGTLKTMNCSLEHDTECTKCYRSVKYADVGNTCNPCGVCEPGFYLQKNCTKFDDAVCTPCPNGTFSKTQNKDRCTDCGNCTEGIITECTNTKDVVCTKKDVSSKPEVAVVIVIVAAILIVITGSIVAVVKIRHRIKIKKPFEDIEDISDEQEPLNEEQERNPDTDFTSKNDNTDKTQTVKKYISRQQTKEDLKMFMNNIGVLVLNDGNGHQDDTSKPGKEGKKNQKQGCQITVMRVAGDFGVTTLQALKQKLSKLRAVFKDQRKGESKTFAKLIADNFYIEFHNVDEPGKVERCRFSCDVPVFEDEYLDIIIFKIKQDIAPLTALKLSKSVPNNATDLKIPYQNEESKLDFKNETLHDGFSKAKNILALFLDDASKSSKYRQEKWKNSLDELAKNIYAHHYDTFDSENNKVVVIENDLIYPKDATTVFICGEYSPGLPCFSYDHTGKLQVFCILTHRVPKIFSEIKEKDQQNHFRSDMGKVTAGIKISAILKKAAEKRKDKLIREMFD